MGIKGTLFLAGLGLAVAAFATSANAQGTFTDKRDGKVYNSVKIGAQLWMAENLNFKTERSWCYNNDESNCIKYGRLYNWEAAKKVCLGMGGKWRLPTNEDWDSLMKAAGGVRKVVEYDGDKHIIYSNAGITLKSESGWVSGGTDDYKFLAMPGGRRNYGDGSFDNVRKAGYWWSATEHIGGDVHYRYYPNYAGDAHYRHMNSNDECVREDRNDKNYGFSVRCVSE